MTQSYPITLTRNRGWYGKARAPQPPPSLQDLFLQSMGSYMWITGTSPVMTEEGAV